MEFFIADDSLVSGLGATHLFRSLVMKYLSDVRTFANDAHNLAKSHFAPGVEPITMRPDDGRS
jgi:hypothetical protein